MYAEYFKLEARPFLMVPDPDFVFWSDDHAFAFSMLRYSVMTRSPITVITGGIGCGKTTLVRKLLQEIPEDLVVGLVSNMQAGRGELLHWVMMALGQPIDDPSYVSLFKRFQDYVVSNYAAGRRVALIFDEAQNLPPESLEELRMLSNINADKDELLQLILVGQPQLRDTLARPDLAQFAQRVFSDFHLPPLAAKDTFGYIQHRLQVAGAKWRIFPAASCDMIHEAASGVPRLINILCDLLLFYAFAADSRVVTEEIISEFLAGARRRGIYKQFVQPADPAPLLRSSA